MPVKVRAGSAAIEVDQDDLIRQLDRVTSGAATSFVTQTEAEFGELRAAALPTWPVRTGKSRDGIMIGHQLRPDLLRVTIADAEAYTYYVKFSVRTRESIEREVEDAAARGGDGEAQAKIRRYYQRRLWRRHGKGAPTERLAGKHVWTTLIRNPARERRPMLIVRLQGDLKALAGGE